MVNGKIGWTTLILRNYGKLDWPYQIAWADTSRARALRPNVIRLSHQGWILRRGCSAHEASSMADAGGELVPA